MLDPFTTDDAFSKVSLSLALESVPTQYGRITSSGLFRREGITTTTVAVEKYNGKLRLIHSKPRGSTADSYMERGQRKVYTFDVPHFPDFSTIYAESYQNVREFGTEDSGVDPYAVMARELVNMRRRMDITTEWLLSTALTGTVKDADNTEIVDYFDTLGGTRKSIDVDLDTSTTDVRAKIIEATDYIDANLKGETATGYWALCSTEFFDKLLAHDTVQEAFKYTNMAPQYLADDPVVSGTGATKVRQIEFGGVIFERYRGSAVDKDDTTRSFVTSQHASLVPLGTRDVFVIYDAPGTYSDAVNTRGRPYYASVAPLKHDLGFEIYGQMNPLPLVSQPLVCVDLYY
jgi:hypothetical protein